MNINNINTTINTQNNYEINNLASVSHEIQNFAHAILEKNSHTNEKTLQTGKQINEEVKKANPDYQKIFSWLSSINDINGAAELATKIAKIINLC